MFVYSLYAAENKELYMKTGRPEKKIAEYKVAVCDKLQYRNSSVQHCPMSHL